MRDSESPNPFDGLDLPDIPYDQGPWLVGGRRYVGFATGVQSSGQRDGVAKIILVAASKDALRDVVDTLVGTGKFSQFGVRQVALVAPEHMSRETGSVL